MRVPVPAGAPVNLRDFLHRCGYGTHFNPVANRLSFVRRLGSAAYPRFHLYLGNNLAGQSSFNLHLDQKAPRYAGSAAHNAEYEGPVVAAEAERIARMLQTAVNPTPPPEPPRSWWPWRIKS